MPLRRLRAVAASVLVCVLAFGLAGCVTLDMDLRVSPQETLDGTMILAFDRRVVAATGRSEERFLAEVIDRSLVGAPRAGRGITVEPYRTERLVGKRYVFRAVRLADFNRPGADWVIEHRGDRFEVRGTVDLSSRGDQRLNGTGIGSQPTATIRIAFPGKVLSTNGELTGRTVVWHPEFGTVTPLSAVAEDGRLRAVAARAGGGAPAVFLLMAVLVALCLTAAWLALRSGRRPRPVAGPATGGVAGASAVAAPPRAGWLPPPASDVSPSPPQGEPGGPGGPGPGAGVPGEEAAPGPHGTRPLPTLPDGLRVAENPEAWSRPTTEIPRQSFD